MVLKKNKRQPELINFNNKRGYKRLSREREIINGRVKIRGRESLRIQSSSFLFVTLMNPILAIDDSMEYKENHRQKWSMSTSALAHSNSP